MNTIQIARKEDQIWGILEDLPDPEMPVVTLGELGILRSVKVDEAGVLVTITPTFSGCPAIHAIKENIHRRLGSIGYQEVEIQVSLSPAWTTDWISDSGREKLKTFGIAPPARHWGSFEIHLQDIVSCPYCESEKTEIRNHFGPTPCRGIAYCNNCQQPFEWFKLI
jgi:ring-1,2-phenylacetyl-CoA epoxidase subunit PaaD